MTRREFVDEVWSWSELIDFCYDESYDLEGLYDEDAKNDYFNTELVEMARNARSWVDLYHQLDDIPCDYEWYVIDDYYGFRGANDDDFAELKDKVLEWADYNDIWEEEDTDEEPEEECNEADAEIEAGDNDPIADEPFLIGELFAATSVGYQNLKLSKVEEREEDEKLFDKMFA